MTAALTALRAALAEATPRPWRHLTEAAFGKTAPMLPNIAAIVHSVNLAPALLRVADAARAVFETTGRTCHRRIALEKLRAALAALDKVAP